ncbi:MAG: C25 family cysteine peptidase, partial [Gammaproteobacteria bacterium]
SDCGGTLTADAGTSTIELANGTLAAGGSCTITVPVLGVNAGNYTNVSGSISAAESGANTSGTPNVAFGQDSLTVIAPPVLSKGFSPASIFTGGNSTLSFTVSNPNSTTALSGIGFNDPLPAGLTVADSGPAASCGGSLSTTAPSTISFSGGSLAANSSCTFSVTVTGTTAGTANNVTSAVTSTEGGSGNAASASLVVIDQTPAIDLTKQVATSASGPWTNFVSVNVSDNVYYRFKVYNSGDVAFTALSISDPTLASTAVDPATCTWPATLAQGDTATCVTGPITASSGSHPNTATASGDYAGGTELSSPSTATYTTTALWLVKSADKAQFTAASETINYSYAVTNIGFARLTGPVTVTDDKTTVSCPAVSTVGNGDGNLDPGEQIICTSSYVVTAGDVSAGSVTNTAQAHADGVDSNVAEKTVNYANPTYAVISSFRVSLLNGGPLLEWTTEREYGTLGFFIERQDPATGEWLRLNRGRMLPGLITAPQGGEYRFADSEAGVAEDLNYRLVEREVSGADRLYGPWHIDAHSLSATQAAVATAKENDPDAAAWRPMDRGYAARPRHVAKPKPSEATLRQKQQAHGLAATRRAEQSASAVSAVRLRTGEEGLYRLDAAELSAIAGLLGTTPKTLIRRLNGGKMLLESGGGLAPYFYDNTDSSLYFVGNAYKTLETDENSYRLSFAAGQAMRKVRGKAPAPVIPGIFRDIRRFEENRADYLLPWVHSEENADYWFWEYLFPPYITSAELTLQLPDPAAGGEGLLKVYLRGVSDQAVGDDREATVSLNGNPLQGSVSWSGNTQAVLEASFDQSLLTAAENGLAAMNVQVNGNTLNGASYDLFLIDRVEVQYDRKMRAYQGGVWIHSVSAGIHAVDGFATNAIKVIENPGTARAKWRQDVKITAAAGSGWQVSFKADNNNAYLVAETGAAVQVEADMPSTLKSRAHNADYLIVAPEELAQSAEALADYRGHSFSTEIVWLQDIYDEFSFGRTASQAIESFLDYAYANWDHVPRYVVLLGRGTLDHRDLLGYHESLIPLRLATTPWGLAGSDNRYADVNGDYLPDYALGRIAVSNEAEAQAYVTKLIAYEAAFPGAWSFNAALVADNPDIAGDFHANSNQIGGLLQNYAQGYTVNKLYHPLVNVRANLLSGWNSGYGYVNYIGHGGPTQLASETFMTTTDIQPSILYNGTKLPIFAALTCAVSDSAMPGVLSLSDTLVLYSEGGAIAAFSPTGLSLNAQALPLNKYFVDGLLGSRESIGSAAVFAHEMAASEDGIDLFMHDIYHISGDPAVTLR